MSDDIADFHVGSASVEIVPDARGWDAKVEAAVGRTQVRIKLAIEDAAARAQMDETTRDRTTNVKADADTTEASAKLDDAARTRHSSIKVKADVKSANADIDRAARNREAKIDVKANGPSWLIAAAAGLGPAVVPLAAGGLAGLAATVPLAAGATGLGLFAGAAKNQVSQVNAIEKQLQTLQKQAMNAATTAAQTKALAAYRAEYDKLNASQIKFLQGESQLSAAWHKLTSGTDIFGPLNQGMSILTTILPKLKPLLDTTDKALTDVLKNVDQYVKSGSFDQLIKEIDQLAGPGIRVGADTLGNLAKGVSGLGVALGPLGLQSLQGLDHLMARFATWSNNSSGEQQFIAYLQTEGPKALHTLGDLVVAITHVSEAAAPWGGMVLTTLDDLLQLLDKIPVSALTPVITGITGVTLAMKMMKAAGGLTPLGEGLQVVAGFAGSTDGALARVGSGIEGLGTRLSTSKLAAGALGAGLTTLAVSATSSSGAVNLLGDTASGALIGFGAGGPIGGAVGGLAGLLGGSLVAALHDSGGAFHAAKADVQSWADAINQGNQAATQFANNQIMTDLEKDQSLLKAARTAGLTLPQTADMVRQGTLAGFANSKMAPLKAQLAELSAQATAYANKATAATGDTSSLATDPTYQALRKRMTAIEDLITGYHDLASASDQFTSDHLSAESKAWVDLRLKNDAYRAAIAKMPSRIQTAVDLLNVKPSRDQIIDLAAKYNATPKSVQTLLGTLGYSESLQQVQHLISTAKELDRRHTIAVNADISAAIAALQGLSGFWKGVFGSLALTDTVINPRTHKSATAVANVPIIGKLLAGGGPIIGPGTSTSDSVPVMASNGEFMMNAKATAAYRPVLEWMNARHLAAGGPVTPGQLASSLPTIISRPKRSRSGGVKPLTAQQLANAQYAFTLSESMSVAAIDKAFHSFSSTLAAHGERVVGSFDRLRRAAEKNIETYAATDSRLKTLQANVSTIQSTAANSFNHAAFGGSFTELVTQLSADKNDAIAMKNAINLAKRHGLSGDFGAQLASSGNLLLAQQIAGLSKAQISSVQALFGARDKADSALGSTAAGFYAREIAQDRKILADNARALREINQTARELPGAVQRGVVAGMHGQSTGIANRTRTG